MSTTRKTNIIMKLNTNSITRGKFSYLFVFDGKSFTFIILYFLRFRLILVRFVNELKDV